MSPLQERETSAATTSKLSFQGVDYVELYVGNAHQAAHFYRTMLGFTPVAKAGPETGLPGQTSILLEQGLSRLLLTSPTDATSPIAEHIRWHGEGVRDVALTVSDAVAAFERATAGGARELAAPSVVECAGGRVIQAAVVVYGDTIHTFVERPEPIAGRPLPRLQTLDHPSIAMPTGVTDIDHVAVCLEQGSLDQWVAFYRDALGFHMLHEERVETEFSAMRSQALQDQSGRVKFVLMEPAPSKRRSQIEDYLVAYQGPGVQHIALETSDIVTTIRQMRANGIEFRSTPMPYYERLPQRVGSIAEDVTALRDLHILADRDEFGYLLQIFAKPVQSRPTLFCEVIQRSGARGFGSGNIKALFESIERDQLSKHP